MTELLRLVPIGKLRNGRVLYMPEPEFLVILKECYLRPGGFTFAAECIAVLVRDQQRVYDAIVTGETRPFEARELPAFATIMRLGV
jgi:hypothetical protein